MSRPTLPRDGPPITPAPLTETTDAAHPKIHRTPATPLLAWPPRMVRRCGLREVSRLAAHAIQLSPCAYSGGVLRRAAQPSLFPSQPLLLKLLSCCRHPPAIQSDST